jgi:hypothetical protein
LVEAVGDILILAEIVDVAPIFGPVGLEIAQLSLVVFAPFVPVLLPVSHRLIPLRRKIVPQSTFFASLEPVAKLAGVSVGKTSARLNTLEFTSLGAWSFAGQLAALITLDFPPFGTLHFSRQLAAPSFVGDIRKALVGTSTGSRSQKLCTLGMKLAEGRGLCSNLGHWARRFLYSGT